MKYQIPDIAIDDFVKSLDIAINYCKMLKKGAHDIKECREFYENMISYIEEIKEELLETRGEFKLDFNYFFMIFSLIEVKNPLVNALVLKIFSDSAKSGLANRGIYGITRIMGTEANKSLMRMVPFILKYKIKNGYEDEFLLAYKEYLADCGSILGANAVVFTEDKDNLRTLDMHLKEVIASNVSTMISYVYNYDKDYKDLIEIKDTREEKVIKTNNAKAYTKENKVYDYIKGSEIKRLCSPKEFKKILEREGYGDSAINNMLLRMINAIMISPLKNNLVRESLDREYQEKWDYIIENKDNYLGIDLSYIYELFYTVPGIDILNNMGIGYRGYGLEKEDIDELMRDAIDCVYNHLRKENKTFCLKK